MSNFDFEIYVASLTDYNNGVLHGVWVDASQDAEDIQLEVMRMLEASPTAREEGRAAEEWAIHDSSGFPSNLIGESTSFEDVSGAANFLAEHGGPGEAWLENFGMPGGAWWERETERLEEAFRGTYESLGDYAQEMCEGMGDVPGYLEHYIDWDRMGRDMELGGDIWTKDVGYQEVYVFSNH